MRGKIAAALGIEITQVGIKATTNEGMGAVGRGEGMVAMAVASVEPKE
jgi:2C-methyl-D-erythritol 2,4-cyclodiphosphate synthase